MTNASLSHHFRVLRCSCAFDHQLAPTGAGLYYFAGGKLDQIQFLLARVSIQLLSVTSGANRSFAVPSLTRSDRGHEKFDQFTARCRLCTVATFDVLEGGRQARG
jgi:hypothetical protein